MDSIASSSCSVALDSLARAATADEYSVLQDQRKPQWSRFRKANARRGYAWGLSCTMSKITIYQFEVWDVISDQTRKSRRWGTREAIQEIAHGRVLEETATEVEDFAVRSDIFGFTKIGFDP
jgi:hypothetical protein